MVTVQTKKSQFVFSKSSSDICIVTCHFNFMGWNTPVRNLNRFLRNCKKDNIPVYGAEAYLKEPETKDNNNWIKIKATERNICFQKEALLNIVIRNLPPNFKKIIVCDHDIFFEDRGWLEKASVALEYFDFIQPFSRCAWTNERGNIVGEKDSFFKTPNPISGHPGFAVGFKRESFEKVWFYPYCIVGGGDTILAGSVINKTESLGVKFKSFFNDYKIQRSNEWYKNVVSQNFLYGYVDGRIFHEYHGSRKNRRYLSRGKILTDFNFANVFINNNGLVEIDESEKETISKIYKYFQSRNEDS